MGTHGQGTSSSMPPVDPNAQGSSSAVGGYYYGSLFGSVNPYEGMASRLSPFPPPPSFVPPSQFVPPTASRWWWRRTMSRCPRPPRTFLGDRWQGEKLCRLKACWSALSIKIRWNRFSRSRWHRFQYVSASVSRLSGKLGGTGFGCCMQQALVINFS
jgi:hypothetical protein